MTTFVNFIPSTVTPFQFQATLDNNVYNLTVPWNLFARRFYLQCLDLAGNLIFLQALTGSPTGALISSLSWSFGIVTVTTQEPHGYDLGQTIDLTLTGSAPDAYNGDFEVLITGASTFEFDLLTNPGTATAFGVANYNVNMAGGYFKTSTLVFRDANQQFEINP